MFRKNKKDEVAPRRRRVVSTDQERVHGPVQTTSYRRNRTITGSSSRNITSGAEMNATMQSPRAQAHHLGRHRRRLTAYLIVVVVATLALYLFVSQLIATVSVRTDDTTQSVSAGVMREYKETLNAFYTEHPFSRYYPSYDQSRMLTYLQRKHPEVANVDVALTGEFGKAQVSLDLRKPVARWIINDQEEYVDANGIVFGVNGFDTPKVTIVDQNKIALDKLNKKVITSNRFLVFVGQVVGGFSQQEYTVSRATIPVLTTRQLQVKLASESYMIKMTVDRPATEQVADAIRVIQYLDRKGMKVEYIDVRVAGKAYYKE